MKIICSKENMMEGINIVQKAVSTKTTMPILEGILLEAENDLKMTANDLEIGIECHVESDIREKGTIVLNSRIFGDIVRRLPDAEILLEVKGNNLVSIECENSYFEIKGLNASSFPAIPNIEKENGVKLNQKKIKEMIKQTIFAVSIDENSIFTLMGSLMEFKDGILNMVSIDGFRMALRKSTIKNIDIRKSVLVPGKTLNEIARIIQPVDNDMTLYATNNQVLFDMGKYKVVSRLLEGEYLNYRGIYQKEYETKVKIKTRDLLASFERASLIITSEERRFPVKLDISEDRLVINSNTNVGTVREELNVEMKGKNIDISFNPRYFIEALRVIDDEAIDIYFTSNISQCTIRPVNGDEYVYLILPLRR